MYSFGSKVLGAAAPKPLLIQFGYALISVLVRLTFTFGATFRYEEMLKVCPLKCKLAKTFKLLWHPPEKWKMMKYDLWYSMAEISMQYGTWNLYFAIGSQKRAMLFLCNIGRMNEEHFPVLSISQKEECA